MNVRPILFSGPMVRALLDGSKTQTRRIVKPQPHDDGENLIWQKRGMWDAKPDAVHPPPYGWNLRATLPFHVCPYGQPGDLLYVRETWAHAGYNSVTRDAEALYRADAPFDSVPWTPSIHMPRWASRLTLRITDVRVQRLQDISDQDAQAEGTPCYVCGGPLDASSESDCHCFHKKADRHDFYLLWDSINGEGAYAANPWVWAVSFEVIKANVDEVKP